MSARSTENKSPVLEELEQTEQLLKTLRKNRDSIQEKIDQAKTKIQMLEFVKSLKKNPMAMIICPASLESEIESCKKFFDPWIRLDRIEKLLIEEWYITIILKRNKEEITDTEFEISHSLEENEYGCPEEYHKFLDNFKEFYLVSVPSKEKEYWGKWGSDVYNEMIHQNLTRDTKNEIEKNGIQSKGKRLLLTTTHHPIILVPHKIYQILDSKNNDPSVQEIRNKIRNALKHPKSEDPETKQPIYDFSFL